MKILDWYILKRYFVTFFVMLLLFVPIGIMVDLSEKVDKMIERKVPTSEIIFYYLDFTVYFANLLFPIFLFLSVIWFYFQISEQHRNNCNFKLWSFFCPFYASLSYRGFGNSRVHLFYGDVCSSNCK